MANSYGPKGIVTDGLVFSADAGNIQSWVTSSTTCYDVIGGNVLTLQGSSGTPPVPSYDSDGGGCWDFDGTDDRISFGTDLVNTIYSYSIAFKIGSDDSSYGYLVSYNVSNKFSCSR